MANPDSRFSQMLRTGQDLFGDAPTNEAAAPEAGANS
jgi:hypothetical protein